MKTEAAKKKHREQKRKWRETRKTKVADAIARQTKARGKPYGDVDDARKMRSVTNQIMRRFGIPESLEDIVERTERTSATQI